MSELKLVPSIEKILISTSMACILDFDIDELKEIIQAAENEQPEISDMACILTANAGALAADNARYELEERQAQKSRSN